MPYKHLQTGVTLVELLVVMTLAAILLSIAVPSYRYVTTSNRIAAEINGLMGDMQFARYEAIKEGLNVTVCPTASATTTTCDATTTWSEGWIVLSNANDNPNTTTAAVLRRQLPFGTFNSTDTLTSSTTAKSVIFNREGFVPLSGNGVVFSLHDLSNNSNFTRCLSVSTAGAMTTTSVGVIQYGVTCT